MKDRVFDVFARKERGDPLSHIGYVSAVDAELARVYAWRTYDEQNWFEMVIVPRDQILPVNRDDGPFVASSSAPPPAGAPPADGGGSAA